MTIGRKYDSGKLRYDLIPADALQEVVRVLTYGATKYNEGYDEENWRKVDHKDRRYFSALMRHSWAPKLGEDNDSETGIHHYAHAITNLLFLLQNHIENSKINKQDIDNDTPITNIDSNVAIGYNTTMRP